jgi:nucleoside-diphosphate-sugar epimerase
VIAILGATGYVGRAISRVFAAEGKPLALFARNPEKLSDGAWPAGVSLRPLASFDAAEFSLVINAIGAGDPKIVSSMGTSIIDLTALWDQRVLATMGPQTRYVFLSSGAVHGAPELLATPDNRISLPAMSPQGLSPYTFSKLQAEHRHRQAASCAILDLRIFGFADPAIDLGGSFFLAQLANCIVRKAVFATSRDDMVRDYSGVAELRALVDCWENAGAPNCALDLFTKSPASKQSLLETFARQYDLKIEYVTDIESGPTGVKPRYFSLDHAATRLGFAPTRDSLRVLTDTIDAILIGGK